LKRLTMGWSMEERAPPSRIRMTTSEYGRSAMSPASTTFKGTPDQLVPASVLGVVERFVGFRVRPLLTGTGPEPRPPTRYFVSSVAMRLIVVNKTTTLLGPTAGAVLAVGIAFVLPGPDGKDPTATTAAAGSLSTC
jgi:hypothetical protein